MHLFFFFCIKNIGATVFVIDMLIYFTCSFRPTEHENANNFISTDRISRHEFLKSLV